MRRADQSGKEIRDPHHRHIVKPVDRIVHGERRGCEDVNRMTANFIGIKRLALRKLINAVQYGRKMKDIRGGKRAAFFPVPGIMDERCKQQHGGRMPISSQFVSVPAASPATGAANTGFR